MKTCVECGFKGPKSYWDHLGFCPMCGHGRPEPKKEAEPKPRNVLEVLNRFYAERLSS